MALEEAQLENMDWLHLACSCDNSYDASSSIKRTNFWVAWQQIGNAKALCQRN